MNREIKFRAWNGQFMEYNIAWPLVDIIERLTKATDCLLIDKGYDGYDYEEMGFCSEKAKELYIKILAAMTALTNFKKLTDENNMG